MEDKPVFEIIKKNYEKMFSAERKVADFILSNPKDAVNSTVSELAEASGISDATVVRMCRHLGYKGYYHFKLMLAKDVGRYEEEEVSTQEEGNEITKLLQRYADSIVEIGENIDDHVLHKCIELINSCNTAHIVAIGNTVPLSMYMGFRLGRLGVKATYGIAPVYTLNNVNLADENDIIIAISRSGNSIQVIQTLELAKEKKLKIIGITGYKDSPVAKLSDYTLISNTRKESFNYYRDYAHLKETAIIDALLELITNWDTINTKKADRPEIILSEYKY